MAVCRKCSQELASEAVFCPECGTKFDAPPAPEPAPAPVTAPPAPDDPRDLAIWRDALESAYRDGILEDYERQQLYQLRTELKLSRDAADALEREIRERFRQRLKARVPAWLFKPVSLGEHVSLTIELQNVDRCSYDDAVCEVLIRGLESPGPEHLGRLPIYARPRPSFHFVASAAGTFDADLRIKLYVKDQPPVVLRSRSNDLHLVVTDRSKGPAQHIQFSLQGERISVGDMFTDKSVSAGLPSADPDAGRRKDEWQEIVLEYDPVLSQREADRLRAATKETIVRPARYQAAELSIETPAGPKRVTIAISALVTLGRNRETPIPDHPEIRPNDIKLRVELADGQPSQSLTPGQPAPRPGDDPSLRITGFAHLTLACLGDRVLVTDNSTRGTTLGDAEKLTRGQSAELEDAESVQLGGVLGLYLETFRSSSPDSVRGPDPGALDALRNNRDTLNALLLGYDKPGEIDAVRIRRLTAPVPSTSQPARPPQARRSRKTGSFKCREDLEHLVIVRQAGIGSGPDDAICLRTAGVLPGHARLLVDQGQLWIECLAEAGEPVRLNDETTLRAGSKAGLISGDVLELGGARLTFTTP